VKSNYRIAATVYYLDTWFVSRVNALHKCDDDDDDDDDDNNNMAILDVTDKMQSPW
jgi:hypothetical protein